MQIINRIFGFRNSGGTGKRALVDATDRIESIDYPPIPGLQGRKVVAAPGTPVQVHAGLAVRRVWVEGLATNIGYINVGFSNLVQAANGSQNGMTFGPLHGNYVPVTNLNQLWVDAQNADEGITYLYWT